MDLAKENLELRRQLKRFTTEAGNNEKLLKRFHERELALLGCGSLAELLVSLTEGLKQSFDLAEIKLILLDNDKEMRSLLHHNNIALATLPHVIFCTDNKDISWHLRQNSHPWLGPYISNRHDGLFRSGSINSVAILPLKLRDKLIGCLALGSHSQSRFTRHHATDFLQQLTAIGAVCLENAIYRERIILTGLTDALTGLYNRKYLQKRLDEEISRARRYQQPLSCIFLDIDFFKKVNDNYGHAVGDLVLSEVALRVKQQLRASDIPTRYGGEEFILLLPQTSDQEALLLAERIRIAIQEYPVQVNEHSSTPLSVTVSLGVSQILAHNHKNRDKLAEKLINEADSALYQAKETGRNRVVLKSRQI